MSILNDLVNQAKKKQQQLSQMVGRDVVHPVENVVQHVAQAAPQAVAAIVHPQVQQAPQQMQRPVAQQVVRRPVVAQPTPMSLFGRVGNTFHNDIISPVQRDVIRPATIAIHQNFAPVANQQPAHNMMQRVTNDAANVAHAVTDLNPVAKAVMPRAQRVAQALPNDLQKAINTHVPTPLRGAASFVDNNVVRPVATVTTHAAQMAQGQNPYHGNNKQIAGQVGTDLINAASFIPVGKVAKGVVAAEHSAPLAIQAAKGALHGAVAGGAIGGGLGVTNAMAQNANTKQIIKSGLIGAGIGGGLGGVTGGAAPLIKPGTEALVKGAKNVATSQPVKDLVAAESGHIGENPHITDTYATPKPQQQVSPSLEALNKRLSTPEKVSTPPNPSMKQTRFSSKTVQESPQVSKEVKAQVKAEYAPDSMQAAQDRAQQHMAQNGVSKSLNQTLEELNAPRGQANRDTLARAIEHAKNLDAKGTPSAQAQAAHIYNLVAEHGSASGQSSQILAAIARRSPAGLRNKAFQDLKKAGVQVTPDIQKEIQGHINAINKAPVGPARDMAIAVLQKAVSKHIPQSNIDKALSVWKAGLLSGVKTQGGNFVSNATFAGLKKVSDLPATMADSLISIGTNKITKTTTFRGLGSGAKQGLVTGANTLKTGIDPRTLGDKYEQHAELNFGNKHIQNVFGKATNLVFRGMQAADQPFYYSAFKNSLYDQAKAAAQNNDLSGKAARQFVNNLVSNPTEAMAATAEKEANKSVLNFDTMGSKAIQAAHTAIDNFPGATPAGKKIANGILNVLAPFVRVPSAFISRTVDFTPFGVGKEVFHQIAAKEFDQRALSQAIGEGLTGTGAIALGIALTQHNLISGDYPKNDPKEAARWKAEGITPNSVNIGGHWISLNYLGPLGLLFNAGNQLETSKGTGAVAKVGSTLAGLGQGLLGQSFLQGFTGFSDALSDPQRSAKTFINSQTSSVVPSVVNDAANASDRWQRQADNVPQSIKNRIPGLRETNPVKSDVYGNNLPNPNFGLNQINPFKPSQSLTNKSPSVAEVSRLHNVNPQDSSLQVTPTPIGKSITIGKQKVTLSSSQQQALQKAVGQATQQRWNQLIKTPEYAKMDDAQKAAALDNVKQYAVEDAQRNFVTKNNLGTYTKAESKKATELANGTQTVAQVAQSKATGATATSTTANHFYKLSDGTKVKSQDVQNTYKQNSATLTSFKQSGDSTNYIKTANSQLDNISKQLQDPKISLTKAQQLANEAQTLHTNINKYSTYGGFTKPKGTTTITGLGNIQNARQDYVTNITKAAAKYGVDANAALAVASAEGLGGGVGDNGTSFGPFQLHVGGALPKGKNQAWAESPEGIDYALQQIANVAKGKTGAEAVAAIVKGFERPLDPNGEISRALSVYNGGSAVLSSGNTSGTTITARSTSSSKSGTSSGSSTGGKSLSTLISEFKLPTTDIKSMTKGAQLARSAHLAKKSSMKA